jgi:SHS2 domain-containing protein
LLDLIFLTDTEGLVFSKFDLEIDAGKLHAVAWGEPLDEQRHHPGAVVKGVTRHMMSIERLEDGSFKVQILFDL